jgi:beta-fructofuranosidase
MAITLPDKWIWDSWYVHDGQRWHGFFLQANKSIQDPDLRHWNVTQGHAISDDLHNWEHQGTCFTPSSGSAWDDYTTWTGSVVAGDDGQWHLFYTGTTRSENGFYQRIGHAISHNLHGWERVGNGLCLDLEGQNSSAYEIQHAVGHWHDRAMRDPWVIRNPDGDGWLMYFTARASDIVEPNAGGAIGLATSPDLFEWTLQSPNFVGGFGQLEVPQVFSIENRWYCLFCTSSEHWSTAYQQTYPGHPVTGSHYLIADHPLGPWTIAPGNFLDGSTPCRRYASRLVQTPEGWYILGFQDNVAGVFGGIVMDPEPVIIDNQGLLHIISS